MNVLIVDDHDLFAEGLKLLLQSMKRNLNIEFVSNCKQALELQSPAEIDLILLDYYLTDGSGAGILDKIRQHYPIATIVSISSDDSPDAIQTCIAHGASGYIPKSSSRNVLIAALELVLSGGTYLPPQALDSLSSDSKPFEKNNLTERQIDVLTLAVRGTANKVIAAELNIAEGTVKAHLFAAYKTMGVNNRTEAVVAFAKYKQHTADANVSVAEFFSEGSKANTTI